MTQSLRAFTIKQNYIVVYTIRDNKDYYHFPDQAVELQNIRHKINRLAERLPRHKSQELAS